MQGIWTFFVRKENFTYLMIAALVFAGLFSVIQIPKESAPEVQVPIAIVTTVFPGASAEDVEQLVTNEIEEQLSTLTNLKELTSSSREGVSVVVAEFDAAADIDESVDEVSDEVQKVQRLLPGQAEDPVVTEVDFVDQPVLLISISSDLPVTEFIQLTDDVEDEIRQVSGVSRVARSGIPEPEVQVIVSQDKLVQLGVRLDEVVAGLRSANSALPVGSIQVDQVSYAIRFEGDIEDPAEINDVAIPTTAGVIYMRDIAFVSDGVSEQTTLSRVSFDGEVSQQAVSLSVFKKRGGDVTRVTQAVRDRLAELEGDLLQDAEVLTSFDTGELVQEDLTNLTRTGLQTVILVMLVLLITIGWQEAVIAAITIPLSFLIAFIGLNSSGNTINFVSLFSLILAVGILIDSAIVVTEAVHTKRKKGVRKYEAATETIQEYHLPLTAGTMTTIAVFAPLAFLISGVTGEFIKSIPFTIIFVLLASLFVALGLVPLISTKLLKRSFDPAPTDRREKYTAKLQSWYRGRLAQFLQHRKAQNRFLVGIVALFIVALSLPVVGAVGVLFFPQGDIGFLFVEAELPQGTPLEETDLVLRHIEEILYEVPEIESFVSTAGESSNFGSGDAGQRLANVTIILHDEADRDRSSTDILEQLRGEFAFITQADIRLFQDNNGPPVGDPIVVQLFSDDFADLEQAVFQTERFLNSIAGTTEVRSSINTDKLDFVFRVDRAKAAEVGLSPVAIASTLRTAVYGTTATEIRSLEGNTDVVVKLDLNPNYRDPHDTSRATVDQIRNIQMQTPQGAVLLGSVITASIEQGSSVIRHDDRDRVASVSAQLEQGALLQNVLAEFNERRDEIELEPGVRLQIGGENEETDQSFQDMFVALIVGMVLIVTILVLQFNSFRQTIFIMAIVPFSLIGILVGLAVTGKAISFPSLMGFIALSGIVVNNSIILIDVMNRLRKDNPEKSLQEVVVEGAVLRLRPILLTTITTIIGMIPLTYASELWAPLAFAIIFGLTFTVFLTLILVPLLYYRWSKKLVEELHPHEEDEHPIPLPGTSQPYYDNRSY